MQLEVDANFNINFSIGNWLKNETFTGESFGYASFDEIKTSNDLFLWYDSFLGKAMYKEHYHDAKEIPDYRRFSIAHNNYLISPVRITQRMIK
jgi:hypothetical protein